MSWHLGAGRRSAAPYSAPPIGSRLYVSVMCRYDGFWGRQDDSPEFIVWADGTSSRIVHLTYYQRYGMTRRGPSLERFDVMLDDRTECSLYREHGLWFVLVE
ncbi:MAG: hypothetical protein Q4B30_06730 [Coriobacteriaceae bacterium]|nr:hypothetical protein [Coriobacteriaceae bacterium]